MMTITRVGVLSCAKIGGILYVVIGLVFGAVFSLMAMAGGFAAAAASDSGVGAGGFAALFGVGAIILFPIFYGVCGFIGTMIMAGLFNLAAGMVGGIEVDAR
jgi:hypothetical protein